MRDYDVIAVRPLGAARLAVRFADGLEGEVIFRDTFFFGVFAAVKDPILFAQVGCDQGFVQWPGNLDLAPDAMHDAIAQHGQWVLE